MKIAKKLAPLSLFLFAAVMLALFPKPFCKAFLDGISLWANNVLPVLLPFALLAPLAASALPTRLSVTKFLFGVSCDGVFFSSLVCGYPVGAKLTEQTKTDPDTALKMSAFCSAAGPIFCLVSVGAMLENRTATAIVFVSQILSCVCNGLLYRSCPSAKFVSLPEECKTDFGQTIVDGILSVLSVGAIIALTSMFCQMIRALLPTSATESLAVNYVLGLLEMTNGVKFVTDISTDLTTAATLSSSLLAFGGASVIAQSMTFLSRLKVDAKRFVFRKITQSALAALITFLLCKVFLG